MRDDRRRDGVIRLIGVEQVGRADERQIDVVYAKVFAFIEMTV